jgi:hypothetical protein
MQFEYFQYLQCFSLLVAIICYKGLKYFKIVPLIVVILLSCISDVLGAFDPKVFGTVSNYWIYNYYLLLSLPAYCLLFNSMLAALGQLKKILIAVELLCIAAVLVNYFFIEGMHAFNSYTLILSEVLLVMLSCITLVQLALKESIEPEFLKHPYFWISVGTLLFSLGTVVVLGLQQYISANHLSFGKVNIYNTIMGVLNIVLFSTYTYAAFLCRMRNNK